MCKRVVVLLTIFLCQLSVSSADEGRIPVYKPTVISEGGHYFVSRNISATGTIVTIAVSQAIVTLDLNGHLLTNQDASSPVISATGDGLVVIRNGSLLGGSDGILGGPGPGPDEVGGFRVEDTIIANPAAHAIHITDSAEVEVVSCQIFDPGADGISAASEVGRIAENFINSPVGNGIRLTGRMVGGNLNFVQAVLERNVVKGHESGHGILLEDFQSARIIDNSIVSGQAAAWGIKLHQPGGFLLGGATVQRNTVRGAIGTPGWGMLVVGPSNQIEDNVVTLMGGNGISIEGSNNTLRGNLTNDNGGHGVELVTGSGNLLDGNSSENNASCGIEFNVNTGNAYRDNMLRGNPGGAVCGAANTDAGGNIL